MAENLMSWLALHAVPGLGPAAFNTLLKHFETPDNILSASEKSLCAVAGIGQSISRSVVQKHDWNFAHDQLRRTQSADIEIITLSDPRYPKTLTQIYAPPASALRTWRHHGLPCSNHRHCRFPIIYKLRQRNRTATCRRPRTCRCHGH